MQPDDDVPIAPLNLTAVIPANDNAQGAPHPQCFRIVIEDEETGQEFIGWGGVTRERAEKIIDFVDGRAVAEVKVGRLARRPWKQLFGAAARPRGRK